MDNQSGTPNGVSDDEIDLMELIANLWDGKWWIAAVTAIFTAAGAGYALLSPNTVTATFHLEMVPARMEANYESLNRVRVQRYIRPLQESDTDSARGRIQMDTEPLFEINGRRLLSIAVDELRSGTPILEAKRNQLMNSGVGSGHAVQESDLLKFSYSVNVAQSSENDRDGFRIEWTDQSRDSAVSFLDELLKTLNSYTQSAVTELFDRRVETENRRLADRLEDINFEIDLTISTYKMEIERRVGFLREQAAIARELGIERNTIEAQTFAAPNGVLTSINTDSPFYLRGYKAIEEEISLISSREDPFQHADGIIELLTEREHVSDNRVPQRARAAFAETPAADETFTAFRQDVNRLEVSSNDRGGLITALSLVLGLMVGMFTVLLRTGLRNYRNRRAIAEDPRQ